MKKFFKNIIYNSVKFIGSKIGSLLHVKKIDLLRNQIDKIAFESITFNRSTPCTIQNIHWKFLPEALGIMEFSEEAYGKFLYDVKVLGPSGTVISRSNELLYDASTEICLLPETHSIFNRFVLNKFRRLSGNGINLAASQSEQNYFHWMTDALPKLAIAKSYGFELSEFDYFIVNSQQQSYQQESLRQLGISPEKIIALDEHPKIICNNLFVTSATCASGNIAPWIIEFLRAVFLTENTSSDSRKKIFIGRKNAKWRRLLNEDEVITWLESIGFRAVFPEDLSLSEQIRLFQTADTVIAIHGAALTNLIFCNPGTKVIELFPPTYINQGYWTISSNSNLKYGYLIGEGIEIENNDDLLRNSDFTVDIEDLKSQLNLINNNTLTVDGIS